MARAKLSDLRTQRRNANKHTPRGLGMLAEAIGKDGWIGAVTVAADGETFDGSARLEVLADAMPDAEPIVVETDGTRPVVVRRTDIASADDPRAVRLGLGANRIAQVDLEFDAAVLADLSPEVDLGQFWNDAELSDLLPAKGNDAEDPGPQIDRAAELQAKWGTALGQLWQIGRHRLLVGDCTVAENVARLMGGEKAAITFTSPPYNAGDSEKLSGNTHTTDTKYIGGGKDNMGRAEYLSFLSAFTAEALQVSQYVFVNIQPLAGNKQALIEYWFAFVDKFADVAIWDKGRAAPAQAQRVMDSRFEFVIIFSENASRAIGTRNFRGMVHNVYAGGPQRNNEFADMHAATMPVDVPCHFIETFTNSGELIYEPFTGTGTTLVACEKLGRIGRGMELSPAYAAVTLERLVGLGLTAELVS